MVTSTKSTRTKTPRKAVAASTLQKKPSQPNASILSFFKKTEKPEDSLFVGAAPVIIGHETEDLYSDDDAKRYNEVESPVKRRKVTPLTDRCLEDKENHDVAATSIEPNGHHEVMAKVAKPKPSGPFMMDSESEDEDDDDEGKIKSPSKIPDSRVEEPKRSEPTPIIFPPKPITDTIEEPRLLDAEVEVKSEEGEEIMDINEDINIPDIPSLKHEDSSYAQLAELAEFDDEGMDQFEGEEEHERRFMREQARFEAEEAGISIEDFIDEPPDDSTVAKCPICDGCMDGVSSEEATRHVNSCLDGNPTPLPVKSSPKKEEPDLPVIKSGTPEVESAEISKRFARAAIPRPPQANPFEMGPSKGGAPKSAFSKLMSNNAEDTAWENAAAAEKAARGRPAYERTCPFYKIMSGFSICVDAFRYGAIEGCQAYFLSHFHSDHYIGLTSSWRHGPIYCSKVTGSLVRHQLRTADKWVVELEFDKPYDVPGTDGATVVMISANHCPGSSLFLFQKSFGKGNNKHVKRILHCGDFRACPAHVAHPLLMPNVVDSISGKMKHQKIDICYLDTTYLNPRYSFPAQGQVISACADLVSNMSPDPNCKDDVWERSAKAIGTPAVSKYFAKDPSKDAAPAEPKKGPRQRLLVICGTYSIGKERICVAIAKALKSKIFASPGKIKICRQLGDPELTALLTSNPVDAQVHMQMLMEIRAETLQEYLNGYKPHFSRIVGFRPSGWNFRPNGKAVGANTPPSTIPTQQILHGKGWRTNFGYRDFIAQRGSTKEAMCFGVPYSEHSSFRELAMFIMSLRIDKVIPTVNVGSLQSRQRMSAWLDRWMAERRRCGLVEPLIEGEDEGKKVEMWDGQAGKGGSAWW